MFAGLLALGVYHVQRPSAVAPGQISGSGTLAVSSDPVVRFKETRIGHLLFSSRDSDDCRRVLFDNQTGAQYDAGEVYCGQAPVRVAEANSSDRMQALRRSFQK